MAKIYYKLVKAGRWTIEGGSYLQVTSDGTVTLLNAGNSQAAVTAETETGA